jgi:hypothetical protein
MKMRALELETLEGAARHYAGEWLRPDRKSVSGKVFIGGPSYVLQDLKNVTYKDEHEFLVKGVKEWLGAKALAEFERAAKETFAPRDDKVFHQLLKDKLAIDPNGNHVEGAIGTVEVGTRPIARRLFRVETLASVMYRRANGLPRGWKGSQYVQREGLYTWPVYAGEAEERVAEEQGLRSGVADPLPDDAIPTLPDGRRPGPLNATNPNISIEACQAALDAITARLDEGSTAATIRGRTGSQPVDPDASETGTLLFTLTMTDPAFPASADDSPGALATASAIADDTSADATNTLTYCRVGATGTGADDHIDGSAGTSAADFIFNTVSIVSGATVSMSSFTIFLSQGGTAT